MHNFLPRLTGVFALFRKTGTTENVPFPSMLCTTLLTDTHNTSNFLPGHRQTILHYQNDQLFFTKHDQHRTQSIQLSDMYTVSIHHA